MINIWFKKNLFYSFCHHSDCEKVRPGHIHAGLIRAKVDSSYNRIGTDRYATDLCTHSPIIHSYSLALLILFISGSSSEDKPSCTTYYLHNNRKNSSNLNSHLCRNKKNVSHIFCCIIFPYNPNHFLVCSLTIVLSKKANLHPFVKSFLCEMKTCQSDRRWCIVFD